MSADVVAGLPTVETDRERCLAVPLITTDAEHAFAVRENGLDVLRIRLTSKR
jgi:hypothetical protein